MARQRSSQEESSGPHTSDIVIVEPERMIPRLLLKLEEYHERLQEPITAESLAFTHPDLLITKDELAARRLLAAKTLASVLDVWIERPNSVITMAEIAERVSEATHINVAPAAEIPFVYNEDGMTYEPDNRALENYPAARLFSQTYRIIQGYSTNDLWGIQAGTGLPEVPTFRQTA